MTVNYELCTRRHPASAPLMTVVTGTELCRSCHADFVRSLTSIADLWNDLRTGARRATEAQDVGFVQTSGHADVGDMWRPQVTQVVLDTTEFAGYLVRLARDIRLDAARLSAADAEKQPVLALRIIARYIARDLTYRLSGGLPAAIVDEAAALSQRAQKALDAPYLRRIPLQAVCNAEVTIIAADNTTTDVRCGGQLYAVLAPATKGGSKILCTHDPRSHRINADQWLILADQLEQVTAAAMEPARA